MSLTLDIVRHGEAVERHADGDAARPLTSRGAAAVRRLALRLRRESWQPDRLFASPYARAQQTAQLLAETCGLAVVTLLALEPESPPQRVIEALMLEGVTTGHVVLVTHLPLVERLHNLLASGEAAQWMPGALVRIELPAGLAQRGRVTWVWTPST